MKITINLSELEKELASNIGIEMHKDLTDIATKIMQSITLRTPVSVSEFIKINRVVMNVSVFTNVKEVEEELCTTGVVTMNLKDKD